MNRIVVDVPNEKMKAFEEVLQKLGLQTVIDSGVEIPEWHKKIVLDRIANDDPKDDLDWDDAINSIKVAR